MRASFAHAPSPVAASVVREKTVKDAISAIRNSEYAGAKAIDLHISCLDDEYKNVESIKEICDCTPLPILALSYSHNFDYTSYTESEEDRIGLLEMAAQAGVSAVDMQTHSYNPAVKKFFQSDLATKDMIFAPKNPLEIAIDEETVKKQMAFIDKMHKMGVEVLLSCHTQVNLNCEEVIALAKVMEKRGPDVIKIVVPCTNDDELAENFKTIINLKKAVNTTVHFHCSGSMGKVTRIVNPMLGAHLAFCIERFGPNANPEQLDLRTYTAAIEHLQWK